MSISEHHRNQLEELEDQLGLEKLSELFYRINRMDNSWDLRKEFGVEMYVIRYLMNFTANKECQCFLYERTHRQELKLIYSRVA